SVRKNTQPRPEDVVSGRPPEGAADVRSPPLGAWLSNPIKATPHRPAKATPGRSTGLSRHHAQKAETRSIFRRLHAGSLQALWVHSQRSWFHEIIYKTIHGTRLNRKMPGL